MSREQQCHGICMPRRSAASPALTGAWLDWSKSMDVIFVSLLSVCHLFHKAGIEPTWRALKAAVERMAQVRVDGTTLRVISAVHCAFVQLEGQGGVDDDLIVRMGFTDSAASRKRPHNDDSAEQASRQPRSFSAKPSKITPLPALIEKQRAALSVAIGTFAQRSGADSQPPPLCAPAATDIAKAESMDAAAASSHVAPPDSLEWQPGEAITARTFCAFLRHPSTVPEYRGQLVHVSMTPARHGQMAPLAEVAGATGLPAEVVRTLASRGITSLYAHQADALRSPSRHLMVATPTSSGKSLVYTVCHPCLLCTALPPPYHRPATALPPPCHRPATALPPPWACLHARRTHPRTPHPPRCRL